jgi:hypothetical protein
MNAMKKLFLTTALIALLGGQVWAQTADAPPPSDLTVAEIPVSDLMGKPVFIAGAGVMEQIGTATDVLLSADGVIAGVLVDTAGTPGLAEKVIAVDAQMITAMTDTGSAEQRLTLSGIDKPGIEATVAYDEQAMADAGFVRLSQLEANPSAATEGTAEAPPPAPVVDEGAPQTFVAISPKEIVPDDLKRAEVYDMNDEQISDVSEVLVDTSGALSDVVIKVGGFFGFGAKSVAVAVEEMQIMRDPSGGELRIYVNASEAALRERPEYEG